MTPKKFECHPRGASDTDGMNHAALLSQHRKVRLWPGLRLEICGKNADTQLTPDEALGLANSIVMQAREGLFQATKSGAPCPGLTARSNPDGVTLGMWHDGVELVTTLNHAQAEALANTITSRAGHLQITCPVRQFNSPAAS